MKKLLLALFLILCTVTFSQNYNPGGVTGTRAWLKTSFNEATGEYEWYNVSCDSIQIYNQQNLDSLSDHEVINLNFNPSLKVSNKLTKEIILNQSNLSQATVIGVFGKRTNFEEEGFLYNVKGRETTDFIVTTDGIYPLGEGEQEILDYGSTIGRDLFFEEGEDYETDLVHFKETTHRILTYQYHEQPNFSVWGEPTDATIKLGDVIDEYPNAVTNQGSHEWNIPEILVYDRELTPLERLKAETYLALKYGITLDKDYTNSEDEVIWSLEDNTDYNNRVTGIVNDTISGLYQPISHTSNEESYEDNYFSFENDSYYTAYRNFKDFIAEESSSLLNPTGNRLLTIGVNNSSALLEDSGSYAIWGDDDKTLLTSSRRELAGARLLQRTWKVNTNISGGTEGGEVLDNQTLWELSGLEFDDNNGASDLNPVDTDIFPKTAITTQPLLGYNGSVSVRVPLTHQRLSLRFGTSATVDEDNDGHYGLEVRYNNVYILANDGNPQGTWFTSVSGDNDILELIKTENEVLVVIRRFDNDTIKTFSIPIAEADKDLPFYTSLISEPAHPSQQFYTDLQTLRDFSGTGFTEAEGLFVELSVKNGKANEFITERLDELNYEAYLIIDQTGNGDFTNPSDLVFIERSRESLERNTIIFENFLFDEDGNGSDAFTFGYKEKDAFVVYLEESKPSCDISNESRNDGSIAVELQFGEAPFTYRFLGVNGTVYDSSIQTIDSREFTLYNIVSGDYTLEITDANNISVIQEVFLRAECEEEVEYPDNAPVFTYDNGNGFELLTDEPEDTVVVDDTIDETQSIAAYPVPVRNGEPLNLLLDIDEPVTIQIVAPTGGIVLSQQVTPDGSDNQLLSYDIYTTPGIYFLSAIKSNGEYLNTVKIIVY